MSVLSIKPRCWICGTEYYVKHCNDCKGYNFCEKCFFLYHQHPKRNHHKTLFLTELQAVAVVKNSIPPIFIDELTDFWTCSFCTLKNSKSTRICDACCKTNIAHLENVKDKKENQTTPLKRPLVNPIGDSNTPIINEIGINLKLQCVTANVSPKKLAEPNKKRFKYSDYEDTLDSSSNSVDTHNDIAFMSNPKHNSSGTQLCSQQNQLDVNGAVINEHVAKHKKIDYVEQNYKIITIKSTKSTTETRPVSIEVSENVSFSEYRPKNSDSLPIDCQSYASNNEKNETLTHQETPEVDSDRPKSTQKCCFIL